MFKIPSIDNERKAFSFPRIQLTEKWDFELQHLVQNLSNANVFFSVFQDEKGDLKLLHSGLNEELYAVMQCALHRHIEFFDFLKMSLINIEKFRNGEMNEALEIMTQAVEYIRIRDSKSLSL